MKKLSALFLSSLLLLPSLSLAVVKPSAAQTPPTQKSAASLEQLAQKVTVKITSPNSQGSGVIIGKRGNNYTVITNAHVIHRQDAYQIQTADGQQHQAQVISRGNSLEGNDLGVVEFIPYPLLKVEIM